MSNAESIVVSLEMAKKLKEAGWPQNEDVFSWVEVEPPHKDFPALRLSALAFASSPSAPTAEEILRRLPFGYWHVEQEKNNGADFVVVDNLTNRFYGETLADAAARCYCYLAENKLLPAA